MWRRMMGLAGVLACAMAQACAGEGAGAADGGAGAGDAAGADGGLADAGAPDGGAKDAVAAGDAAGGDAPGDTADTAVAGDATDAGIADAVPDAEDAGPAAPDVAPAAPVAPDAAPAPDADAGGDAGDTADVAPAPWRSALFPADWTPATTTPDGLFLHDFSYAGYRNGKAPFEVPPALETFDVTTFGADPTGALDATDAIQAAIDAASVDGGVVWVPPGTYWCAGTLQVGASHVVIQGAGAEQSRLAFSRSEGMSYAAHLTIQGATSTFLEVPLAADGAPREASVRVASAEGLAAGQDVEVGWVITPAFVEAHGMTGTWEAFNGTWQAFYRRTIVSVHADEQPPRVVLDVPLRSAALVSDGATLRVVDGLLEEVAVLDLGVANAVAWQDAWAELQVHAIAMRRVKDAFIGGVASFPSPFAPAEGPGAGDHLQNSGIEVTESKRVTVADTHLERAQNRGSGGCGYLFELRRSSEILTRDCTARHGRHNYIQNWGFGLTGCVWLRCTSEASMTVLAAEYPELAGYAYSEFHHSLATANLIDSTTLEDGWKAENRNDWSTGAGHTATENVFWNTAGGGKVFSRQWGAGHVIGTAPTLEVVTALEGEAATGTAPEDHTEGLGQAATLDPPSLYEAQLERRLAQ